MMRKKILRMAIGLILTFPGAIHAHDSPGADNDGVNNEPFQIFWDYWQYPWFKGFAVNLGFVFSFAVFRLTVSQIRREERIKAEFERRLNNVEMTALRSQMNPHFIFNCLNSIDYYILKNETEKASDYLNRFSRLIRLILQNSRANYVNLRDELEALRLYIEMESLRFHEQFDYRINLSDGFEPSDVDIPPMLLQPYVENAIWHGLLHRATSGRLEVFLSLENGYLFCTVEDNGIGRQAAQAMKSKSASRQKSMGVKITEDRIQLINRLYDTNARVKIIDLKDRRGRAAGTRVELSIPIT